MSLGERPRGSARPTPNEHYNSLPRTSIEGALEVVFSEVPHSPGPMRQAFFPWPIGPGRCGEGASAAVDVAPVRDSDHIDPLLPVVDPVERPPLADPDAVAVAPAQVLATGRAGIVG